MTCRDRKYWLKTAENINWREKQRILTWDRDRKYQLETETENNNLRHSETENINLKHTETEISIWDRER